jgi:hypothetical protein
MRTVVVFLALLAAACNEGVSCNTVNADVGDLCIPGSIAPDIPLVLDVRELCGLGCGTPPSCSALFRNGQVVLSLDQDVCNTDLNGICLDQGCLQRVMHCNLPALSAGDYTLVVPGGRPRVLHVAAGGNATCRFPAADAGVQ